MSNNFCFYIFLVHLGRYVESVKNAHINYLLENPVVPGNTTIPQEPAIVCPVCREKMKDVKAEAWIQAPKPKMESEQVDFKVTDELKEMQTKMKNLYLKQKAKGSIIDPEEEGKKFLVLTTPTEENNQDTIAAKVEEAERVREAEGRDEEERKMKDNGKKKQSKVPSEVEGSEKRGKDRRRGGKVNRHQHYYQQRRAKAEQRHLEKVEENREKKASSTEGGKGHKGKGKVAL